MKLSDVWGQGQIFAFSALCGNSYSTDDFVGILCGDKIGIRFIMPSVRELVLSEFNYRVPTFEVVSSDLISINYGDASANIVYADRHLIVGNFASGITPVVCVENNVKTTVIDGVEVHDTFDGDYTALLRDGNVFSFAYGKNASDVISLAKKGISLNIETEKEKKLRFYESLPTPTDERYAPLYYKCISVMKSQLYSPEANFKRIWSTPDRVPHKHLWLWDSVFHAIGFRNIAQGVAEDLILAIFDNQSDNGFIPHAADVNYRTNITQPPVIAWGAYLVYLKTKNVDFLKTVFEKNKKFLMWCRSERRALNNELYSWHTDNDANCRCGESGMDNSPRFDTPHKLQAIDYSCYMANDVRYMKKIADVIGYKDESHYFNCWFENIKRDINEKLWDEAEGFYYDYDLVDEGLRKVRSVASFLPLFAGICDQKQANALYAHLNNPETFYTEFPIPSIAKTDATFGTDMWRGPVWVNFQYMIACGLREYGYNEFSDNLEVKTINELNRIYKSTGTIFEFYDCESKLAPYDLNRKGLPFRPYNFNVKMQAIRDYGWSVTLLFDLLFKRVCK